MLTSYHISWSIHIWQLGCPMGQLAKDYVTYPTRVLEASLKQIDGQDYWTVSLSREGAGIPNRDDFLVHAQSGEVIHTMSAQ